MTVISSAIFTRPSGVLYRLSIFLTWAPCLAICSGDPLPAVGCPSRRGRVLNGSVATGIAEGEGISLSRASGLNVSAEAFVLGAARGTESKGAFDAGSALWLQPAMASIETVKKRIVFMWIICWEGQTGGSRKGWCRHPAR